MRAAKEVISKQKACVQQALLQDWHRFVGHVGRFGLEDKPMHIVKAVLLWRPLEWWKKQQFWNELNWDTIYHARSIGGIRSFERHLPTDWLEHVESGHN